MRGTLIIAALVVASPLFAGSQDVVDVQFGFEVPKVVRDARGDWSVVKADPAKVPAFKVKRIEAKRTEQGNALRVAPAVRMIGQTDRNRATFVVMHPDSGYTWRFEYDTRAGEPKYVHGVSNDLEWVEVTPPGANQVFLANDTIERNYGLYCKNYSQCNDQSGVPLGPCIACVCSQGSMCDSDDTGLYTSQAPLQPVHLARLQ